MITPELVARMLNTLLEGLGLAAIVWLGLRVFKPLNSGTRFAVWFFALVAIVTLPFLGLTPSTETTASLVQPRFVLPEAVAGYLFMAWAVIATILLARLGLSLLHVRRLRRNATEIVVSDLHPALCDIFADTSRPVHLLVSDGVRVPAALGFFRPAIIVPTWAMHELPVEDLRTIFLHEFAHLRRWDDWTNLAQKLLKALFFFHPAVWWIESRLSLEREMACDDMVLAEMPSPRAYAVSLVSLAERVGLAKTAALAQAALGHARHTSFRIAQILNSKRPKGIGIWKPALGFGGAILTVAFLAVPYAPNLVAFANPEPRSLAVATPVVPISQRSAPDLSGPARSGKRELSKTKFTGETSAVRASGKLGRATFASNPRLAVSVKGRMPQAQMVLVMQSTEFDETGTPVFTLCVWQITDKNSQQVRTEIVMHSL